jgi:hypothetical protein
VFEVVDGFSVGLINTQRRPPVHRRQRSQLRCVTALAFAFLYFFIINTVLRKQEARFGVVTFRGFVVAGASDGERSFIPADAETPEGPVREPTHRVRGRFHFVRLWHRAIRLAVSVPPPKTTACTHTRTPHTPTTRHGTGHIGRR